MTNIVLVDLDGTLANCDHRLHHIQPGPERDWDAFYESCHLDQPHLDMIRMVNAISDHYLVIILTGRREETRAVTEEWLHEHGVEFHALIMRPVGNRTDDHVWKIEVGRLFGLGNIAFVVEDRNRIVEAWREAGLRVLHVADGPF
jgi:phosphoglycolate phosphatase-like HAD superfamily hydrolase